MAIQLKREREKWLYAIDKCCGTPQKNSPCRLIDFWVFFKRKKEIKKESVNGEDTSPSLKSAETKAIQSTPSMSLIKVT